LLIHIRPHFYHYRYLYYSTALPFSSTASSTMSELHSSTVTVSESPVPLALRLRRRPPEVVAAASISQAVADEVVNDENQEENQEEKVDEEEKEITSARIPLTAGLRNVAFAGATGATAYLAGTAVSSALGGGQLGGIVAVAGAAVTSVLVQRLLAKLDQLIRDLTIQLGEMQDANLANDRRGRVSYTQQILDEIKRHPFITSGVVGAAGVGVGGAGMAWYNHIVSRVSISPEGVEQARQLVSRLDNLRDMVSMVGSHGVVLSGATLAIIAGSAYGLSVYFGQGVQLRSLNAMQNSWTYIQRWDAAMRKVRDEVITYSNLQQQGSVSASQEKIAGKALEKAIDDFTSVAQRLRKEVKRELSFIKEKHNAAITHKDLTRVGMGLALLGAATATAGAAFLWWAPAAGAAAVVTPSAAIATTVTTGTGIAASETAAVAAAGAGLTSEVGVAAVAGAGAITTGATTHTMWTLGGLTAGFLISFGCLKLGSQRCTEVITKCEKMDEELQDFMEKLLEDVKETKREIKYL
jgi:hypothetical protein